MLTADFLKDMLTLGSGRDIARHLEGKFVTELKGKRLKLPTIGKSYGYFDEVVIDKAGLNKLLTNVQIKKLFSKKYWLAGGLQEWADKLEESDGELQIYRINAPDFMSVDKLKGFLGSQDNIWLKQFYGWCMDEQKHIDSIGVKPIFRTQSGGMIAAYKIVDNRQKKPQIYLPLSSATSTQHIFVPTVHMDLLHGKGSKKAHEFMSYLKIPPMDIVAEVQGIVNKIENAIEVNVASYKTDFDAVFGLWKKAKDDQRKIMDILSKARFVLTTNNTLHQGEEVYFNKPFLHRWFEGNHQDGNFLHRGMDIPAYMEFYERLGVNKEPKKINDSAWVGRNDDRRYGEGLRGFHPEFNFEGLEYCLKHNIDLDLSVYLLGLASKYISKLFGKYKERNRLQDDFEIKKSNSTAGMLLTQYIWLYNNDLELMPTKRMKLSDLHEKYEGEVESSDKSQLEIVLNFKPESYTEEQVRELRKEDRKIIEEQAQEIKSLKARMSAEPEHSEPIDTHGVEPITEKFIPRVSSRLRPSGGQQLPDNSGVSGTVDGDGADHESNTIVGRAGEEIAYMWLKKEWSKKEHAKITWENEHEDQGIGYDFMVKNIGDPDKFFEVKSTQGTTLTEFTISKRQWEKAVEEQDNYCVLLVRLVGNTKNPPVKPIYNLAQKINTGEVKIRTYKVSL